MIGAWAVGELPNLPEAACIDADPWLFFPPAGGNNLAVEREAKAVCLSCTERTDCLSWALENDVWGIWGGTTDRERRTMRRKAA